MIRTLRALFLGRLLREKLLLVAFAGIGLLWWLSAFSTRANAFGLQQRRTTAALKEQQQWLDRKKIIESEAQKVAAQLDPAKTLDATHLHSAMQALVTEAGFKNTRPNPLPDKVSGQFSIHTIEYTIQGLDGNAGWMALTKFYAALRDRSPYIVIETFTVNVGQGNAQQHNVLLRVCSFEFVR